MINVSSAMGGQFAWSAAEQAAEIRQMGPNPLRVTGRDLPEPDAQAATTSKPRSDGE